MKRLIAALFLWSSTVQAQDMTPDICKTSVQPLEAALSVWVPSPTVDGVGRCTSLDVVLFEDETMALRADRIYWRIEGAERWIEQQLPPTRIEIELEGIRAEAQTGDVVLDYLLKTQSKSKPIFGSLVVDWDSTSNRLVLEDAYLDFGTLGHVEITGAASGVDLTSPTSIRTSGLSAVLERLNINIETTGLFEAYALVPLGTEVLRGEADPARAAAIIKAHRIDDIRALDNPLFDEYSKDALIRLVAEMPNPNGTLDFAFRSDEGLSLFLLGSTLWGNRFDGEGDPLAILSNSDIAIAWTTLNKP